MGENSNNRSGGGTRPSPAASHMPIGQLIPNIKDVNLTFIILDIGHLRSTKDGNNFCVAKVADGSGSVNLSLWKDSVDAFSSGDILRLKGGHTQIHRGQLSVSVGRFAELHKIGEFFLAYSELPNMSEYRVEYGDYQQQQSKTTDDNQPTRPSEKDTRSIGNNRLNNAAHAAGRQRAPSDIRPRSQDRKAEQPPQPVTNNKQWQQLPNRIKSNN